MRIGIITHWWCHENYGQLLQCYALQAHLKALGHEPFLIKYIMRRPKRLRHLLYLLQPAILYRKIKDRYLIKSPLDRKKALIRSFDKFRNQFLATSATTYTSLAELNNSQEIADAYICGSDQVWLHVSLDDSGKPWFLDFGPPSAKRVAYAASFGKTTCPKEYIDFARPLLAKFDRIGVREKAGLALSAAAGRPDAIHVADPTLLLSINDYLDGFRITSTSHAQTPPYAFVYYLRAETDTPWPEIQAFILDNGLKVKATEVNGAVLPFEERFDPTIPEWIRTINEATVVFTNSFHGTVFAILARRSFLTFPRKGETKEMNERIASLLEQLDLTSRLYNPELPLAAQMHASIEWEEVEKRLAAHRSKSIAFLKDCGF